ncbi:MAG TPA: alpha/beta hydrolase-fold protein [Planctomycetota bacterium]|nr:alpha/beta hydrolase-fold protein [Planctomycetota bacterium]
MALGSLFLGITLQGPSAAMATGSLKLPGFTRQQEGKLEELRKLRRERRKKEAAGKKIQVEIDNLSKSISTLIPEITQALLKDLKAGSPEAVSQATARLAEVGTPALPELESLAKSGTPDEQARAKSVLKWVAYVEAGDSGLWKQWAASGKASSEYSGQGKANESDWSAQQACGKPDTDEDGDHPTAWASQEPDGGQEWLELTYKAAVRPAQVRVHESFNPGAVARIEALDAGKKWQVLWKGKDSTTVSPGILDVQFDPPNFVTRVIRITLDSSEVEGWNEIDAVQLIGEPSGAPVPVTDIPAGDAPAAPKGTVRSIRFDSKNIGAPRNVKVWLPPGHDPQKSYPVFYTCDGMLNVNMKLVEPLIADGRIPPIIVVAIMHGPNLRMQEYVPQVSPKDFDAHEKWFIEEVLPWAEKEFGASKNRMERIVCGSSNGGPFSLTMGARHPDLFGNVVGAMVYALAVSKWKDELAEKPKKPQTFLLYAGRQDDNGVRENAGVEKVLKERGYQVSNTVVDGEGHTNRLNQTMLPKVLEEFFGKKQEGEKGKEKDKDRQGM